MKEKENDYTIEYTPVCGLPIITLNEPAMEEIVKNYKVGQGCSCVPRWPYLKK